MLFHCLLLSSLAHTAVGHGFRQVRVVSGVANEDDLKGSDESGFLQTGLAEVSEVKQLSERAANLQDELSKLTSDELQAQDAAQQSDENTFAKLREQVGAGQDPDEPEDEVEEEAGGSKGNSANTLTRPSALAKKPDEVEFGLFAKTFYGVDVKTNSFTIDLVMTLKWFDQRVVALIPAGLDQLTLSKLESEKQIWLPGMVITNRDIKRYDLISTAVFIKRSGEVFKVERATAIIRTKYLLDQFPFDRQVLPTKIASHKYMLKDVVLKPAKDGSGVKKGLMEGESYSFVKVEAGAYEDTNGALKKSRGVLNITVDRIIDKYTQSHLIPGCLLMMISWGVFWFPFVAPFITPRLAMSVLTLVNFTYLTIKSALPLPAGAPFNWNDVINRTILTCMFATVVLNILSEICLHQLKVDDLARRINNECKVFLPFITITSLGVVLSACGRDGYMSIEACSTFANIWLCALMTGYILLTFTRIMSAMSKNRLKEVALVK